MIAAALSEMMRLVDLPKGNCTRMIKTRIQAKFQMLNAVIDITGFVTARPAWLAIGLGFGK
jgi:hypothetical protein